MTIRRLGIRSFARRERLDDWIDRARLRVDMWPRSRWLRRRFAHQNYQPVPALGLMEASRAEGTATRWEAMRSVLDDSGTEKSAVDIGAATGFFTLALAERGLTSIAVEPEGWGYRTTLLAIRRAGLVGRAGVLVLPVTPENVNMLPEADVVVFLSVWHHLVNNFGIEAANGMLEAIWAKTHSVLFFETGESEMPDSWGLPDMSPDPRAWLEGLLTQHCAGGMVRHLGLHQAFDADVNPAARNLFAVHRQAA
jgi:hypothetical protein